MFFFFPFDLVLKNFFKPIIGYKEDAIKININKDGTVIEISGEKTVQEMVMKGWMMFKKEPEMKGFKKTFKIPRGVILDRIKAKYNEEDSILTICMPKESKGKTGDQIEEVKDEQEVTDRDKSKAVKQANQMDETPPTSKVGNEEEEEEEEEEVSEGITPLGKLMQDDQELQEGKGSNAKERKEDERKEGEMAEKAETSKQEVVKGDKIHEAEQARKPDEDEGPTTSEDHHQEPEKIDEKNTATSKLFPPCFCMGTAIIIPLVVLAFSLIRPTKKQS